MDINSIIDISRNSTIAKSCRRIFFNHLNDTSYTNGFHVDVMYGSGSGTLLFFDGKYFLLTAKHVIAKNNEGGYQNDSPFWVSVRTRHHVESLYDFLFPKYSYEIGALITNDNYLIDNNDVILIELFDPMPQHLPDHFVDLTSESSHLEQDEYFEYQILIANGYPFQLNSFNHEYAQDSFTHSTNVRRHSAAGICHIERNTPYIGYEHSTTAGLNPDGMSGGVVCNACTEPEDVRWAGLILSGNQQITRFLPAWCIFEAIQNYNNVERHVIDPAAEQATDLETLSAIFIEYMKKYGNPPDTI